MDSQDNVNKLRNKNDEISLATSMVETAQDDHALIYLNTIGRSVWEIITFHLHY